MSPSRLIPHPADAVRVGVVLLGLLVPIHLPFALPTTSEGAQLGWWAAPLEPGDAGPVIVRQTIWSARNAGLRPGDVIVEIDGEPATTTRVDHVRSHAVPGDTISLRVRRSDATLGVEVPVRARSLSYTGYLWYRLALALAATGIALALVWRLGREPATLALAVALMLLPPVLSPIEIPPKSMFFTAANAVWQVEAAAYRFFFPALFLHFLTLPLLPLRRLRGWRVWTAVYVVLGGILLAVTNGLRNPVAWASPGLPYEIRSWAGLTGEAGALAAAIFALHRTLDRRSPAQWLAIASIFAFGAGVATFATTHLLPDADLMAEGLRQVKSITLLILMVMAGLYAAVTLENDRGESHFRGRMGSIASAILTGLYAFAVAGAAAVIHSLEDSPEEMGAVLFIGIFVATLAYSPVLRWAREMVVDRQILAKWAEQEQRINAFIDRISAELAPARISYCIESELPPLLGVRAARLVMASETAAELPADPQGMATRPRASLESSCRRAAAQGTIAVPVRHPEGPLIAVLEIEPHDGDELSAPRRAIYGTLARGLAATLRNTRAHMRLRDAERELHDAERIASLGALAGGLAHEIKNPLAGLKMGLYVLEQRGDGAPGRFERLRRDMRRIDDLVNSVLRLTHDGIQEDPEAIDVHAVIRQCLEDIAPRARERTIDLVFDPPAERMVVEGGPEQVRLIVSNLVSNAVDAVPEGGSVEITTSRGREQVSIVVRDDGPGIPPEHRERIFDLSFTTKSGGTGLGLALVRREAQRMGGAVEIRSAEGRGTELHVLLPRAMVRMHSASSR